MEPSAILHADSLDWRPGMQHHQKIAVYFNLPVYFVVPEEN